MSTHKARPPKLMLRFFRWFCRPDYREDIEGDLLERFETNLVNAGPGIAKRRFTKDVLLLFRPGIVRSFIGDYRLNQYGMFKHNIKIGYRNIIRNKGFSFLNIGGLAVGMAVAMLIGLWVWDEVSYNTYHKNHNQIGQVMRSGTLNGDTFTFPYLPYALDDELKDKYGSKFKNIIVASLPGDHVLNAENKNLNFTGRYIDHEAPKMFSLKILRGISNGLKDPYSVLLSLSASKALFGDVDPLQKTLLIDNKTALTITGVYEDLPHNSFMNGTEFLVPWELFISQNPWVKDQGFKNNFLNIYVELNDNISFDRASILIKDVILNNVQNDAEMVRVNPQLQVHPMDRWHLYGEWENGVSRGDLINFVRLFGIIGIFVLILACINFMNLSTARSEKRAKEVGIRKAAGSVRRQLITQFFAESFLMILIAFFVSVVMVFLSLERFNELAGKQLELPFDNPYYWIFCLIFLFITGLLSGSYPALYLSSFQPMRVLKGTFVKSGKINLSRQALVVFQFTVSVSLIMGTFIVFKQINFVKDRSVGYDRENLIMVQMTTDEFYDKYEAVRAELLNSGAVNQVAQSLSPVTGIWSSNSGFDWRGMDPDWQQKDFATLSVSHHYGKTVEWQIVKGRDFDERISSDSSGIILNETAAKLMGFEHPPGEVIGWNYTGKKYHVLGVVKDMIMDSPYSSPMPTVFYIGDNVNWINIRLNPNVNTQEALTKIESAFRIVLPDLPLAYRFADSEYAAKFLAEERVGKLSGVFTILAIFISCLGIFGLAAFTAERRLKEIGIRKILGASVLSIWQSLSMQFLFPVILSGIISVPIAYFTLNNWLQNYEYRTALTWEVFALAVITSLAITLLTVSYQSVKAALSNPADSLRSE